MDPARFLIPNKMAPVDAWVRTDLEGKRRTFKSWYEFLAWFDERHHGKMLLPPNAQETFVDVLVDTLTDSPRKRAKTATKSSEAKGPGGPPSETSRVAVKRNHGVRMDGREFPSLFKAFSSLGWPDDSRFQRFRKELKEKKKLTLEGRTFELVE